MATAPDILGRGIYAPREVADLVSLYRPVSPAKVRRWLFGRSDREPLLAPDYPVHESAGASFLDMVDVLVVAELRRRGFTAQFVRRFQQRLQREDGGFHPLARKELVTLGKKVLVRTADELGNQELIDLATDQAYFSKGLEPLLKRIDYGRSLAERWRIAPGVVVDPQRSFGAPVVDRVGVPTGILADSYFANGEDTHAVARFFGIRRSDVRQAVTFERRIRVA